MKKIFNYSIKILHLLLLISAFSISNSLTAQISGAAGTNNPNDTVVRLKTSLDNTFLCPDKKEAYLYIDLKGCNLGKRIPLNISIVFDRSGSMKGDRIHHAKLALEHLIDHLLPTDILSIVLYDHETIVLHGAEPVTDKNHLKRKLEHIQARGSTNISAGLELGYKEVLSNYDSKKINKVFLMTDGIANEGITDEYLLEKIVKSYSAKNNISLTTFGLGHEFNEELLHNMAEAGGGHYYYIENAQDAAREFGGEIKTLLSVVANNATLEVEFPSDYFGLENVYGQHYTLVNNSIYLDLKEVHPNETNGILIKFYLKNPLAKLVNFNTTFTYDNIISNNRTIQTKVNTILASVDKNSCATTFDDDVVEKIVYFTSNELLEMAIKDRDNNNIGEARMKLEKGKSLIKNNAKAAESTLLKNQYKAINDYENHLSDWHNKTDHEKEVIHKKTRHANYKLRKMKG